MSMVVRRRGRARARGVTLVEVLIVVAIMATIAGMVTIVAFPELAIFVIVLAFNLLGDALRDMLRLAWLLTAADMAGGAGGNGDTWDGSGDFPGTA